jgi:hypothetical protein
MALKTPQQVLAELKRQPGIDIAKQPAGTTILVETTQGIYELVVKKPEISLVEVTSTDPRLHKGTLAQLNFSTYDIQGRIALPHWIGKSLRMQLSFKNTLYPCSAAISAAIVGDGFHFEVF